jgi:Cof subfamily protein (haloacid dehalogenase superfamily)
MRAIFFDVDNTLSDEKTNQVVKSSWATLLALKAKGYLLFIATSRALSELNIIADLSVFDGFVVNNGGRIYYRHELIKSYYFTEANLNTLITWLNDNPQVNMHYRINEDVLYTRYLFDFDNHEWFIKNPSKIEQRDLTVNDEVFHCFLHHHHEIPEGLMALDNVDFQFMDHKYINLLPQRTNKAVGIKFLIDYLGLAISDCACVGDSLNDYPMFELITECYCIGNGHDDLKSIACEVINDIWHDPIYHLAINKQWVTESEVNYE